MQLSNFKVIPQSNVRKNEISLEDLKPLFVPEVVKPDLIYDEETKRFKVKLSFIKNLESTEGFTAITDGISTYLIKTSETDINIDLRPKFLKSNVTQYFKSDYLRLLTKDLGNDLFLHETKIEDYQAFLVSNNKVNPFEKLQEVKEKWKETLNNLEEFPLDNPELPIYQTQLDVYSQIVGNIDTVVIPTVSESVSAIIEKTNEDSFTYTSDLLDQPVEENVEEPSLF